MIRPHGSVPGPELPIEDARAGDWVVFPAGLALVRRVYGDGSVLVLTGDPACPIELFDKAHLRAVLGVSLVIRPPDPAQFIPEPLESRRSESQSRRASRRPTFGMAPKSQPETPARRPPMSPTVINRRDSARFRRWAKMHKD